MKKALVILVVVGMAACAFGQWEIAVGRVAIPASAVAATKAAVDRQPPLMTNVSVIVTNGVTVRTNTVRQVVAETDRAKLRRLLLEAAVKQAQILESVGRASEIKGE